MEADLDKPETLEAAFRGANAIFGNIDSIGPMYDPHNYGKLRPGQTINELCYELEVRRGKNMANAAAGVDSLERFVFSGLPSIKLVTDGKYSHAYHFEAKSDIVSYIKSLPNLAGKASEVQLGEFATNWKSWRLRRPVKVCNTLEFDRPPCTFTYIFNSKRMDRMPFWYQAIKTYQCPLRCRKKIQGILFELSFYFPQAKSF